MKRSMKTTFHSDAYVEWRFTVYQLCEFHPFTRTPIWCCRIDLIGDAPHQVFDAGETPLQAFTRTLDLADRARIQHNWLRRN